MILVQLNFTIDQLVTLDLELNDVWKLYLQGYLCCSSALYVRLSCISRFGALSGDGVILQQYISDPWQTMVALRFDYSHQLIDCVQH